MTVFSSPKKLPYFAIILSSKLRFNDLSYRIMVDKMLDLAKAQPGYLGAEYGSGEMDVLVSYWQDQETASAWLNHQVHRRVLSISEQCWYEEYSLKLLEVITDLSFKHANVELFASRFPRIVTKRGVLTVLDEAQAPLLFDYLNQEKAFLTPWEPQRSEGYYSLETCQLRIREIRRDFVEGKGVVLCFLSPNEDRMLAYSNYSNIIRGVFQACNLGYSLRESEQGKGMMHEALSAGVEYLHKEWQIDRIQATYMPRNIKSAAVLEKLGFDKEGLAKSYLKINGVWEDHILTALVLR
ncbi:GNAT family N-acetyltransferase [Marinomonas sp. M1K-6]|uniref:GNAT family N-acetyltransferase n=1 Tax=Marinomonas profundi TaxID=2726122 RepID=A0A847R5I6_9GAMM|nr:GNAT family N-acetyltransferase [Marinomonas profundi]NLQ16104.1 GNAT family N-acetyltransferase [Marinomonas profundi]UDV03310.1 GNAT family N-acetyltransferase [Marinomonas profundi]